MSAADVLVKYTYYGDTDFNGRVSFDDYVRTDNGFNNQLTGWANGDFDLNGVVNFDDYVLVDLAFNTQSRTLGSALRFLEGGDIQTADAPALGRVGQHFLQFGSEDADHLIAAVPEPPLGCETLAALVGVTIRRLRTRRPRRGCR